MHRIWPSNLLGGQHGHFCLVLYQIEYYLLSNKPWACPVHPRPLVIPHGTTHNEYAWMKKEHGEYVRLFK